MHRIDQLEVLKSIQNCTKCIIVFGCVVFVTHCRMNIIIYSIVREYNNIIYRYIMLSVFEWMGDLCDVMLNIYGSIIISNTIYLSNIHEATIQFIVVLEFNPNTSINCLPLIYAQLLRKFDKLSSNITRKFIFLKSWAFLVTWSRFLTSVT